MAEDANITGLSFTVKGATDASATSALDNLVKSLNKLKALSSGFNLSGVTTSIQQLGRAIQTIDVEKASKIKEIADSIKSLSTIKSNGEIDKIAVSINRISNASKGVEKEASAKLTLLGKALASMSNVNANISPGFADEMRKIVVVANNINANTGDRIRELGDALSKLKGNISISKEAGNNLISLINAVDSITDAQLERLERLNAALSNLKGAKVPKIKEDTGSEPLKNSGKQATGTWAPAIKSIADSIRTNIGNAFKEAAETGKNVIVSVAKKIPSMLASFGKAAISIPVKMTGLRSALNGLKKIGDSINALKRIAVYRLLRSAIKAVTDAVKEGTDNAYWYSKTVAEHTKYIAEAYDALSSATFKMENQLGAAWGTLISAITPILLQIISLVTRAAEAVTRFFAVLGGKTSYLKAVDYSKDWADATDKGAKAAKEWKNQLMGFDVINRLEAPSDTGRSSGKKEYDDYENMFEEEHVDGSTFFEQLKSLADSGEWKTIGEMLGNKVNEVFAPDNIDWDGLGRKIGTKINNVISTALSFLKTVDFVQIGKDLSASINGIFTEINFEDAGRLLARRFTAIGDFIIGAIKGIDWKLVATALSDYILGALREFNSWLQSLNPTDISNAIKDFFGNIKYEEIGTELKTLFSTAFRFALEVVNELLPDDLIPTVVGALTDFFTNVFGNLNIGERVKTFFEGLSTGGAILVSIAGALLIVGAALATISTIVAVVQTGASLLGAAFAFLASPIGIAVAAIAALIFIGIQLYKHWDDIKEWAKEIWTNVSGEIKKGVDDIKQRWEELKENTAETWQNIKDSTAETWSNIKESASETWSNIKEGASRKWEETKTKITTAATNIFNQTKNKFDSLKSSVTNITNALKTSLTTAWNGIKASITNVVNGIKTSVTTVWTNISTTVQNTVRGLVNGVSNILSGLVNIVSNVVNSIRNAFNFEFTLPRINLGGLFGGGGTAGGNGRLRPERMATGGVVTRRSILEVGEDGREAIIPLENNTQWISNVASQISTEMGYGNFAGDNEDLANDIRAGVYDAVVAAMDASGGRGGSKTVSVNINGREFYRATFDDYKTVSKERGISLISA